MEKTFPTPAAKKCHDALLGARRLVVERKILATTIFSFGFYSFIFNTSVAVLDDSASNLLTARIAVGNAIISTFVTVFALVIVAKVIDNRNEPLTDEWQETSKYQAPEEKN